MEDLSMANTAEQNDKVRVYKVMSKDGDWITQEFTVGFINENGGAQVVGRTWAEGLESQGFVPKLPVNHFWNTTLYSEDERRVIPTEKR